MKKILTLLIMSIAWTAAIAGSVQSVTLKSNNNLVGEKRIPHKKLSAEEVALKNCVAFVLYDWKAYSETLPLQEAKKWKNRKLTPGLINSRAHSLQSNHQYTIISSKDVADKKIIVIEEKIKTSKFRYKITLEKTEIGWIVIKSEEQS